MCLEIKDLERYLTMNIGHIYFVFAFVSAILNIYFVLTINNDIYSLFFIVVSYMCIPFQIGSYLLDIEI